MYIGDKYIEYVKIMPNPQKCVQFKMHGNNTTSCA